MKEYIILSYLIGLGISIKAFPFDWKIATVVFLLAPIIVPIRIGIKLMED